MPEMLDTLGTINLNVWIIQIGVALLLLLVAYK